MSESKVILETKDLTKKFGGLTAVNNVSIHVDEGEIVGLIGANGAGKTTLFNMCACAFAPTSGEVIFNGQSLKGKSSYQACRMGIGRTYQIVKPFQNLTVWDNVTVGALLRHPKVADAKERAAQICKLVGLGPRMEIPGAMLNLAERKRMELARAIASEPKIMLLDEVMAGLNPKDSARVIELVQQLHETTSITFFMIEHVMKAIMTLSHRVYVMNQGCLIAHGTPEEVTSNSEVIKSYLGERYNHAEG